MLDRKILGVLCWKLLEILGNRFKRLLSWLMLFLCRLFLIGWELVFFVQVLSFSWSDRQKWHSFWGNCWSQLFQMTRLICMSKTMQLIFIEGCSQEWNSSRRGFLRCVLMWLLSLSSSNNCSLTVLKWFTMIRLRNGCWILLNTWTLNNKFLSRLLLSISSSLSDRSRWICRVVFKSYRYKILM